MLLDSDNDTLWAGATNGSFTYNGPEGGEPFTGSPTSIECYYKYTPSGNDTAYIGFEFFQQMQQIECQHDIIAVCAICQSIYIQCLEFHIGVI